MRITEAQRWTIICGLEVAIEEYRKLSVNPNLTQRIMKQFADQADDAQAVIDTFEAVSDLEVK